MLVDKKRLDNMGVDSRRVVIGKKIMAMLPPDVQKIWKDLDVEGQTAVLRRIKELIQKAREADPIAEWMRRFTPDQLRFLFDPEIEKILSGGNRSGKSITGCFEDVVHFTGQYPEGWPETHRFPTDMPRFVWVCSPDRMVQTEPGGVQDTILNLLPPGSIKSSPKVAGHPIAITHIEGWDGSRIVFKAYGAGAEVFQSAGIHHIHYDEEPPMGVYFEALQRGVQYKGTTSITMTPVKGITWVYERLVKANLVGVHYIITADNPSVDNTELTRRDQAMTKIERLVRRSGRFLPMVGHPRFDLEPFSEALETAQAPSAWIDLIQDLDEPDNFRKFKVVPATEMSYRPLAVYVDPRGRKDWKDRFVIGVDTSEGKEESTECAAVVYDRYQQCVAAVIHGLWDPTEWGKMMARLGYFYNEAYICPEANNMGIIVVRDLVHNYGALYVRERAQTTVGDVMDEFGFYTSNQSKARMEGHAIKIFNSIGKKGAFDLCYGPLISQGMTYQRTSAGTGKHAAGTMDDILIACMLSFMMDLQAPGMKEPGWEKTKKERDHLRSLRKRSSRPEKKTTWMSR